MSSTDYDLESEEVGKLEAKIGSLMGFIRANVPAKQDWFGKYKIQQVLSQTKHAFVVKAFDSDLERVVVLKVYPHSSEEDAIQDIFAEGRACAKIESEFVANCVAVEKHESQPFLVLEFINGQTITEAIDAKRPTEQVALDIIRQVAQGIADINKAGFLHLDLKPCNVVLDYKQRPKIVDFGLARPINESIVERFAGTPGFVAPELSKHLTEQVGRETDVYGLGAILFFMLTGSPPVEGSTKEEKILNSATGKFDLQKLDEVGVSRKTKLVVAKCLANHPSKRYPTATAFIEDISESKVQSKVMPIAKKLLLALGLICLSFFAGWNVSNYFEPPLDPDVVAAKADIERKTKKSISERIEKMAEEGHEVPRKVTSELMADIENFPKFIKSLNGKNGEVKSLEWQSLFHFWQGNPEKMAEVAEKRIAYLKSHGAVVSLDAAKTALINAKELSEFKAKDPDAFSKFLKLERRLKINLNKLSRYSRDKKDPQGNMLTFETFDSVSRELLVLVGRFMSDRYKEERARRIEERHFRATVAMITNGFEIESSASEDRFNALVKRIEDCSAINKKAEAAQIRRIWTVFQLKQWKKENYAIKNMTKNLGLVKSVQEVKNKQDIPSDDAYSKFVAACAAELHLAQHFHHDNKDFCYEVGEFSLAILNRGLELEAGGNIGRENIARMFLRRANQYRQMEEEMAMKSDLESAEDLLAKEDAELPRNADRHNIDTLKRNLRDIRKKHEASKAALAK